MDVDVDVHGSTSTQTANALYAKFANIEELFDVVLLPNDLARATAWLLKPKHAVFGQVKEDAWQQHALLVGDQGAEKAVTTQEVKAANWKPSGA